MKMIMSSSTFLSASVGESGTPQHSVKVLSYSKMQMPVADKILIRPMTQHNCNKNVSSVMVKHVKLITVYQDFLETIFRSEQLQYDKLKINKIISLSKEKF